MLWTNVKQTFSLHLGAEKKELCHVLKGRGPIRLDELLQGAGKERLPITTCVRSLTDVVRVSTYNVMIVESVCDT